jgi:hypothetical protein
MFEPTHYDERVAHALGLNHQELQDKFKQGEFEHKIAGCDSIGRDNCWLMKTQTLCFRPICKIELQHTQSEARGGNIFVIPVPFSKEHKGMLAHAKELLSIKMAWLPLINGLTN